MSKSDYLEGKLLDHQLGGPDYVRPATIYVALFTATPSDAGGGTEVTGGSYARAAVTNNATNFPAASGTSPTSKSNAVAINFTTPTADWGTVTAFGYYDAASAGNLLRWNLLSSSKVIQTGDPVSFPIGALVSTED